MLKAEVDRSAKDPERAHPLIKLLGAPQVVSDFRKQLLTYANNQWPFMEPLNNNDTLGWWEALEQHPHARVLAVSLIH